MPHDCPMNIISRPSGDIMASLNDICTQPNSKYVINLKRGKCKISEVLMIHSIPFYKRYKKTYSTENLHRNLIM